MPFKIILGAIIGGALMFGGGYIEHMLLHWGDRQMKSPKDPTALLNAIKAECPDGGVYVVPKGPDDMATKTSEEQKAIWDKAGKDVKEGNYAFAVSLKPGKDFAFPMPLIYEGVSNVIACLLAAIVVSMTRPSIGFIGRWFVVMVMALFAWASINTSYHIWYHFPLEWVQDELLCGVLEAAMAGVAIAAIVAPRERMNAGF